jgi:uncharacterized protein (TIGR00725 family)
MPRFVTVFGGSGPTGPDYNAALRLGKLLGQAGCTVLTGGYIGTMEAVSRGAAESGAHVIGVTCEEIEAWRTVRLNRWVQEERRFATLRERLYALIDGCQAAIALPGGPGTLAEIAVMWNHLLTAAIAPRPLILVGPGWQETFGQLYRSFDPYIPERQRVWITFAENVDSALEQLFERLPDQP